MVQYLVFKYYLNTEFDCSICEVFKYLRKVFVTTLLHLPYISCDQINSVNVLLGECWLCSKESNVQCSCTFWVYSWSQRLWLQCRFQLI